MKRRRRRAFTADDGASAGSGEHFITGNGQGCLYRGQNLSTTACQRQAITTFDLASLAAAAAAARLSGSGYRDDFERRQFAFGVAHGHIFALTEKMIGEAEAGVLLVERLAEFEAPIRAAAPAGAMHKQPARLVVAPEAAREIFAAMRLPRLRVDLALSRQRRDEFVAMPNRALGERLRAGGVQGHFAQWGHGFPPQPSCAATAARALTSRKLKPRATAARASHGPSCAPAGRPACRRDAGSCRARRECRASRRPPRR